MRAGAACSSSPARFTSAPRARRCRCRARRRERQRRELDRRCARRSARRTSSTDGDRAAYEIDWRKRFHGRALAVVRPGTTAEVAAVVSACRAARRGIVAQGGNTGLVGGSVPDASGTQVLLSTGAA